MHIQTKDIITRYGTRATIGENTLHEKGGAKLSRIWYHMQNTEFAIMSAYRGEYTEKENIQRTIDMHHDIRNLDLGAIQMFGYWYENKGTEQEHLSEERSWFIPNPQSNDEHKFKDDMIFLGNKYDQEAIILGDKKYVFLLDCKTKEYDTIGHTNTLKTKDVGEIYSKIKGKNFTFSLSENINFNFDQYLKPDNQTTALLMKNRGLYP